MFQNIRAILKQLDQHVKGMMIILQDINSDGGVEHSESVYICLFIANITKADVVILLLEST